ncbi:FAD-dependent oxidoreductase [Nocardioides mangrovicus]|uniref:FAD-dependent oxidoreductase n=1 Tax=Nocardioides mangrovicus TaxID=2478913 RepID=A0A3L8NW95_9ACTN|nr:FAD-dependent oxidoreductase [Nocardioides mangrovicus]RLV47526.1 FAD-dependent oxidoreductase [Nocardioides mangrovicus]
MTSRRVAVVGSGVSGLVAAWVLARDARVTLYEADDRLGGHADTHDVEVDEHTLAVDTGFIVHNERTYPTLLRLFDELGVVTQESDMSMSVRDEETGLEWAGALGARGLFPTSANLRNPRYLRMLVEIPRFHRMAKRALSGESDETLASFLARGRFSEFFTTYFMTPLVAAVWSADPDHALEYPARYLFTFLEHHGMLTVFGSPTWRTVAGGSREYVERVAKRLDEVRLSSPVSAIREHADGVDVTDPAGTTRYDAVVVATHPDQALRAIGEPTPLQRELLGAIPYAPNVARLHTDERLLPRAEGARASWNYLRRTSTDGRVLVSYDMTRLQRLRETGGRRYIVTLGGEDLIDPASVIATMHYAHPVYTPESVAAQRRLPELNSRRVAFAGAYHGWGFHEDGALSGLRAAEHLGGTWPERATRQVAPTPRIYATRITHARVEPLRNVFSYASHTWLVDLDDLPHYSGIAAPLLRRLARFEARDHVGDPALSLRANIDALLAEHGIHDVARVQMLAHPRTLGYVFNPISVFWCHREDHSLAAVVVEVHNTYGGRHAYVVHPDEHGRAIVDKELYVSPFNDTSGTYHVAVPLPGETVNVAVTLHREGRPPFTATMKGTAGAADARGVLRSSLRHPVVPLLGSLRIRIQGIKLWLRGLPVQPRPRKDG